MWGTEAVRDLKGAGEEGEEQVGGTDIPEDAGHTRSKLFPRSLWEGRKEELWGVHLFSLQRFNRPWSGKPRSLWRLVLCMYNVPVLGFPAEQLSGSR